MSLPFQKLEFTLTFKSNGPAAPPVRADTSSSASSSSSSMTPEEISVQLRSMLSAGKNKKKDQLNEDIFNWVDVSPVTSDGLQMASYDLLCDAFLSFRQTSARPGARRTPSSVSSWTLSPIVPSKVSELALQLNFINSK